MTIEQWITKTTAKLDAASIDSAKLDAELLLSSVLSKDRSWLHAHPENILHPKDVLKLEIQSSRRAEHEPMAYILGVKEFYGREFIVSPEVLTPRPETETMIELLVKRALDPRSKISGAAAIVDIGTGSGCIILSAALELSKILDPRSKISYLGLDVSSPALKVARQNTEALCSEIFRHVPEYFTFDLMKDDLNVFVDTSAPAIILANLPYIPTDHKINRAAAHEPEIALFSGTDGLNHYRELFRQIGVSKGDEASNTFDSKSCVVFTESLEQQHAHLTKIASDNGYRLMTTKGLIQVFTKK